MKAGGAEGAWNAWHRELPGEMMLAGLPATGERPAPGYELEDSEIADLSKWVSVGAYGESDEYGIEVGKVCARCSG